MSDLDPAALSQLYRWIDTIPLDRPKKNIARDFSDGVLMSQVVHYFFPKLVELHNYSASNSIDQKNYNWKTMNQKVFKKMGFLLSPLDIEAVVQCKKHAIERILLLMQTKIGEHQANEAAAAAQNSAAQYQTTPPAMPSPAHGRRESPPAAAAAAVPAGRGSRRTATGSAAASAASTAPSTAPSSAAPLSAAPSASASLHDLRETVDILQLKVQKLEQLLRLKNSKIASLQAKLEEVTGQPHS